MALSPVRSVRPEIGMIVRFNMLVTLFLLGLLAPIPFAHPLLLAMIAALARLIRWKSRRRRK